MTRRCRCDELARELDAVRARLTALETRPSSPRPRVGGLRDDADLALTASVAAAFEARPFRAKDVFAEATRDPALRAALRAADISTTKEFGRLLSGVVGELVEQLGTDRGHRGLLWKMRVCGSEKPALDPEDDAQGARTT